MLARAIFEQKVAGSKRMLKENMWESGALHKEKRYLKFGFGQSFCGKKEKSRNSSKLKYTFLKQIFSVMISIVKSVKFHAGQV